MASIGRKTGRNERCRCGCGEKFKRCHGSISQAAPHLAMGQVTAKSRLVLDRLKAREKQREQQQGFGKAIISAEVNGTRFVAVGKKLMQSDKWKTVHDFLGTYLLTSAHITTESSRGTISNEHITHRPLPRCGGVL